MNYRFFVEPHLINWQEKKAVISESDYVYKMSKVLRLKENDQIVLLDGKGLIYNAQIISFYSRAVQCRLLSRRSVNTEADLKITIAQTLLRGPNFDYALQKNTEVGVFDFIPITTERTVIRLEENGASNDNDKKSERFQKIARSASEQSERGIVPQVHNILSLEELCKQNLTQYDLKLVCLERAQNNAIKEVLNSIQDKINKVLVLIGPEGGFSDNEAKLLLSKGFTSCSLGKRIYRAETIGVFVSAILFFYFNELK